MCDETTERELDAYLKAKALTRRGFAAGAAASVVAGGFVSAALAGQKFDGERAERARRGDHHA